jgi:hypothetical protein
MWLMSHRPTPPFYPDPPAGCNLDSFKPKKKKKNKVGKCKNKVIVNLILKFGDQEIKIKC